MTAFAVGLKEGVQDGILSPRKALLRDTHSSLARFCERSGFRRASMIDVLLMR